MVEKLSLSVKKLIKEEIKNATQQAQNPTEMDTNEDETSIQRESHRPNIGGGEDLTRPSIGRKPTPALQNCDESTWTEVVNRRRSPKSPLIQTPTIVGTKHTSEATSAAPDNELEAACHRAWLYIGHLHQNSTQEKLVRHLKKLNVTEILECEEIQTRGSLKAFKVGIPLRDLHNITNPASWPEGAIVRRYRFFRPQSQGARLEN